jgi:Amt family ammonium transporter
MMAIPGLALFMAAWCAARTCSRLLMQVFVTFSLIVVLWVVYGYSLAFTEGNAFIGGLDRMFLRGVFSPADGTFAMAATFSKAWSSRRSCSSSSRPPSRPSPAG